MCVRLRSKFVWRGVVLAATALLIAACGGGGGGAGDGGGANGGVNSPPPATAQGTVGIVITDHPTDRFDQVLATITQIDLLGDDGSATVFTGLEVIDLKQLASYSELFAVADVDAGVYEKIRLSLTDLELVALNPDGTVAESFHPKLPANGKIDLNPRRDFVVTEQGTLLIEMDFDIEKSFKYHEAGNGTWHFRPVVFVRVLTEGAAGRLSRVYGQIGEVETDSFELCQRELMSDTDDDSDFDESDDDRCIEILTNADTGIFSPTGDPTGFDSLVTGDFATAIGFMSGRDDSGSGSGGDGSDDDSDGSDDDSDSANDDDSDSDSDGSDDDSDRDRFVLEAVVVELGEAGTFAHLKGTAQSAVDDTRQFELLIGPGQGFGDASIVTAQLQDGAKIYSRRGAPLGDGAIGDGVMGAFDGVLMLANDAPDLLKTVLAILDLDFDAEDVLRGEILTAGEDRRLMVATDTGDRCVDVPLDADVFLVSLVEGRVFSDRGSYGDLVPGLAIDVYGDAGTDGCFVADTIIADSTDVTPPPAGNQPPVADAGPDQAVQTGGGVMLDGNGSSDPDGDALTYGWTLDAPVGSAATLAAADTATPSFTTDVDGDYVGTLVVNDGQVDSAPDTVTVTASSTPPANRPPVADAGADQAVETGNVVTLDGSGSSDPDGDALGYGWTLDAPIGSAATLAGADTATPSFTADVDGDYVATLVVNDGSLDSDPDSLTVTAATTPSGPDGVALYTDNCQRCHGPLESSEKANKSAADIQQAIDSNRGGMGILSFLTPEQVQAIADALATP
jgi:mono/diheme cytochrome c family protein